jgi:hypothetical protein
MFQLNTHTARKGEEQEAKRKTITPAMLWHTRDILHLHMSQLFLWNQFSESVARPATPVFP